MADFTTLRMQLNTGSQATPTWTAVPAAGSGTGQELRWSDQSNQGATASASWPYITRPASNTLVNYLYVFSADTTSLGYLGGGTNTPAAFSNSNYNMARWDWDNTGTFASAPIFTAYTSTAHGAPNSADNSMLGGNATDTSSTSYVKGNAFGRVASAGAPAAAPTNAPTATNGTVASTSTPTAGANWLTNYQGLNGDSTANPSTYQNIQFPSTPAATTADDWYVMFCAFVGPNEAAGTYTPVLSLKYTYG